MIILFVLLLFYCITHFDTVFLLIFFNIIECCYHHIVGWCIIIMLVTYFVYYNAWYYVCDYDDWYYHSNPHNLHSHGVHGGLGTWNLDMVMVPVSVFPDSGSVFSHYMVVASEMSGQTFLVWDRKTPFQWPHYFIIQYTSLILIDAGGMENVFVHSEDKKLLFIFSIKILVLSSMSEVYSVCDVKSMVFDYNVKIIKHNMTKQNQCFCPRKRLNEQTE